MLEVLTSSQAAEYLGLTRQRVDQLGAAGEIPRERMGFFWVYRREDLERWKTEGRKPRGRPKDGEEVMTETQTPELVAA